MAIHIGVTATRHGVTPLQLQNAVNYIFRLTRMRGKFILHHGDCVGGDEQMHTAAMNILADKLEHIYIHPPLNERMRAFCRGPEALVTVLPEKDYQPRNCDIVDQSQNLIALPWETVDPKKGRGGTWNTVRYAISKGFKEGEQLEIFYP